MRTIVLLAAGALLVVACESSNSRVVEKAVSTPRGPALTADQCNYFVADGKVRICHYTGDAKKPYSVLNVDDSGCINGHADHPNDFIALPGDTNCQNMGCLPDGAPVDTTTLDPPCCQPTDGSFTLVRNGVCAEACDDLNCPPVNNSACFSRACNPGTGVCETSVITGRGCGNECATDSDCTETTSPSGAPDPCVISTCIESGSVHVCAYATTSCDDGDPCTQDWCESGVGCHHKPIASCTP
jgi:hypothetical protein